HICSHRGERRSTHFLYSTSGKLTSHSNGRATANPAGLSLGAVGRINHIWPRSPRFSTFCIHRDARHAETGLHPRPESDGAFALDAWRKSSGCLSRVAKYATDRLSPPSAVRRDAPDALRIRHAIESRALSRAIEPRPRTNPAACRR